MQAVRELQKPLREGKLTEQELLAEVRLLMNKESEHQIKMAGNKKSVGVKELDILNGSSGYSQKKSHGVGDTDEGKLCSAITALTTQVSELTCITKERDQQMKSMQEKVDKCMAKLSQLSGSKADSGGQRFKKCDDCAKNKKYCRHCFTCGSDQHKAADCPEND